MKSDSNYVPALGFHALTPLYDLVVGLSVRERTFRQALLEQADIEAGQRVLDLGCGTGTLLLWGRQAEPGAHFYGIDGDVRMLARARAKTRRVAGIDFDCALATALPFVDASFDRVLSSLFFHHLDWPAKQQAAREALRVLKPGGTLHVADWGRPSSALMRLPFYVVQLIDGFPSTRDNVAGRLPELFSEAGFDEVEQSGQLDTIWGTLALYRARKKN